MAKLEDIKSKGPDSRLTSLGTTFRPGAKRIALPTSKYSPDSEVNAVSSPLIKDDSGAGVIPSSKNTESINIGSFLEKSVTSPKDKIEGTIDKTYGQSTDIPTEDILITNGKPTDEVSNNFIIAESVSENLELSKKELTPSLEFERESGTIQQTPKIPPASVGQPKAELISNQEKSEPSITGIMDISVHLNTDELPIPIFYGKPTDPVADNLRITSGKPTDLNIDESTEKMVRSGEPTDQSTDSVADNLRITSGNLSNNLPSKNLRTTSGYSTANLRNQTIQSTLEKKVSGNQINRKENGPNSAPLDLKPLVGFQRAAFFWIASESRKHGQNDGQGNRISPQINGTNLALSIQKPYKSTKDLVYELVVKQYLEKMPSKAGPAGYSQYIIKKSLYQEWLHEEALETFDQLMMRLIRKTYGYSPDNLRTTSKNGEPIAMNTFHRTIYGFPTDQSTDNSTDHLPSKLVSNNILTNLDVTTETLERLVVADIQLDVVTKLGITRKHIQDLKNQKLNFTTSALQDFVNRFAVYASDPSNIKRVNSIPALFCKLAQLASKGDDPLLDIETEENRAVREAIELLKAKRETKKKQDSELFELTFEAWLDELSMKERERLVPPTSLMKTGSVAQKMTLKQYFTETIWPEKARQFGITSSVEANT